MKNKIIFLLILIFGFTADLKGQESLEKGYQELRQRIISEFGDKHPVCWSEVVPGVKARLDTDQKVLALTFDACGSPGDGYDSALINYLIENNIPATLFINARWIDKNPSLFKQLAENPLFEIENHGMEHKPCSVDGKSVYGIQGTRNAGEVVDEIEKNGAKIKALTGRKPVYYRSGTAYYDEVGVAIARRLGYAAVGFSVLGDAGATYSQKQVKEALLGASPGSIIICHMNHPEKETAEGVMAAVPLLKKKGFKFVKLSEYDLTDDRVKIKPADPLHVPILLYHHVAQLPADASASQKRWTLSIEKFDDQMRWIAEHHFSPVSMAQLSDALKFGKPLPANPIVISFDDGWKDQYEGALPILKKYHFPATFFIIADSIGHSAYMNWDQVRAMADAGMDMEAHSKTHERLSTLSPAQAWSEVNDSKKILEEHLHKPVVIFAYPYGSYSNEVIRMVRDAQFETAVTVRGTNCGYIFRADPSYVLSRYAVEGTDKPGQFPGVR